MSAPRYRTLDVRPFLNNGTEPFSIIRGTVDALKPGEGLLLISPFLPSPLIEILKNEGFEVRSERLADGSWQTRLLKEKP